MTEVQVLETIADVRAALDRHRAGGQGIGFVPTMGFLHEGHRSLMRASVAANDVSMVSIFVNPLQFAPDEDLDAYPRDIAADSAMCSSAGVDYVFVPSVDEMYAPSDREAGSGAGAGPIWTNIHVGTISEPLEGRHRPTHFDGVATVVTKLFGIVGACRAYFGEKDWQQLAIVRRLAFDLSMPVEVVGCPIIREDGGLAMSSRNVYLTDLEREQALVLNQALRRGIEMIEAGQRDPEVVVAAMTTLIEAQPSARIDYVAAVDAATLQVPERLSGEVRVLTATRFGKARLLDNRGTTI